ncbi:hypothetical protein ABT354_14100 [Streptomyces sp. NPDC000594]|uniref:hypothetical protein n=1 Tax=Streptomyces sp. NPDC000594 TaxID=3154261 RepID=UPI0033277E41
MARSLGEGPHGRRSRGIVGALAVALALLVGVGTLTGYGGGSPDIVHHGPLPDDLPSYLPEPETLWGFLATPDSADADEEDPTASMTDRPAAVPGVLLPPGSDPRVTVDPRKVIARDPGIRPDLRESAQGCWVGCERSRLLWRDITGDSRHELLVFLAPRPERMREGRLPPSGLYVYWVHRQRIHQILDIPLTHGSRVDHQPSSALLVRAPAPRDRRNGPQIRSDRYTWNAKTWRLELTSRFIRPANSVLPPRIPHGER